MPTNPKLETMQSISPAPKHSANVKLNHAVNDLLAHKAEPTFPSLCFKAVLNDIGPLLDRGQTHEEVSLVLALAVAFCM